MKSFRSVAAAATYEKKKTNRATRLRSCIERTRRLLQTTAQQITRTTTNPNYILSPNMKVRSDFVFSVVVHLIFTARI